MKTKFSEILKVKKQKVSEIEQQLAAKRFEKEALVAQSFEISAEIGAQELPKEGSFAAVQTAYRGRAYLYAEKERVENMIQYLDDEIEQLQNAYKAANIEYEKIKYLHENEKQKKIAAMMQAESKRMDEIAGQLFGRKVKEEF